MILSDAVRAYFVKPLAFPNALQWSTIVGLQVINSQAGCRSADGPKKTSHQTIFNIMVSKLTV